jgi:hypothetical protein
MSHLITLPIKTLVQRVLNAAETGTADGKYHDISIFGDGKGGNPPDHLRQIPNHRTRKPGETDPDVL